MSGYKWLGQLKWDGFNLRTVSTRLRAQDYENFKALCESVGGTMHSVLRMAVAQMLKSRGLPLSKELERDIRNYSVHHPKPSQYSKDYNKIYRLKYDK